MPLQHAIIFLYGRDGWRGSIPLVIGCSNNREGVTTMNFYMFRKKSREEEGNKVLQGRCLFQQFVVDYCASIDDTDCDLSKQLKVNCEQLFTKVYGCSYHSDIEASVIGQRFVLPTNFIRGPRIIIQHYQDGMTLCRIEKRPGLFITFTCNSNWIEIPNELARMIGQYLDLTLWHEYFN